MNRLKKLISGWAGHRLDRNSFAGRMEWSLRGSLSYFVAGIVTLYCADYIAIPIMLPTFVLSCCKETFGASMKACQSNHKGISLICIISSVANFVPLIDQETWPATLIYFFCVSLFLTIALSHDATSLAFALSYHITHTLDITYADHLSERYNPSECALSIWHSWTIVPMAVLICFVGLLGPFPGYAYNQLLYCEKKSVENIQNWLSDIILFFQCTDKIEAKIQRAKIQKYHPLMIQNRANISLLYPTAKDYEMLSPKNKILDQNRIDLLQILQNLLLGMHDAISSLEYDSFHIQLLDELKEPLQSLTDYMIECLNENYVLDNEQMRNILVRLNNELLEGYRAVRHKILFKEVQPSQHSVNIHHAFIYFLISFSQSCVRYSERRSEYRHQELNASRFTKAHLFSYVSIWDVLYPFPFDSWSDLCDKLSPLVHWKSAVFLQSLSVTIALTLCAFLFIFPPIYRENKHGFWAAITVAFVSDENVGGSFHTSALRLEGTFYGVCFGYIIMELQSENFTSMPMIVGVAMLTVWNVVCGYYRSNPTRGYSAYIATVTATLLVVDANSYSADEEKVDIEHYAVQRVQMTFIGIGVLLIVLLVFSPNNARKVVNVKMVESLSLIKELFNAMFIQYESAVLCAEEDITSSDETSYDEINYTDRTITAITGFSPLAEHQRISGFLPPTRSSITSIFSTQQNRRSTTVFLPSKNRPVTHRSKYEYLPREFTYFGGYSEIKQECDLEPTIYKSELDLLKASRGLYIQGCADKMMEKIKEQKSKVAKSLDSQKILIHSATFEPYFFRKYAFNEELYFKLNRKLFWMLRRVSQIDLCLRSLLVYVEKRKKGHWMFNEDLVHDFVPFETYLHAFEKCHHICNMAFEHFINTLSTKIDFDASSEFHEDIMRELNTVADSLGIEFENMIHEAMFVSRKKSFSMTSNINWRPSASKKRRDSVIISAKGALTMQALTFAVNNLINSLLEFAECKLSY